MATEREIKQDFTIIGVWWILFVLTGILSVSLLLIFSWIYHKDHDWHDLAFAVGYPICAIWFIRFCFRTSLERAKADPKKWLLADDGLVRVYSLEERETIRWEQIRDMRWGRHLGLKVRWEESKHDHRSQQFLDEFRKPIAIYECWIIVGQDEARELFRCAKRDWFDMKL